MTAGDPAPDRDDVPDSVADARLQHERTTLAWDRTAVAIMVAGSIFLHAGNGPLHSPRHVPGMVAIALGAVILAHAYRRYERLGAAGRTGTGDAATWLRLVAVTTLLFSLASLALVLGGG